MPKFQITLVNGQGAHEMRRTFELEARSEEEVRQKIKKDPACGMDDKDLKKVIIKKIL